MSVGVRRLRLWRGAVDTEIEVSGRGAPLLYLHGSFGLEPERAFVERLAASHTVYAPKHPGTSRGDDQAVHRLDSWLDLVVYYGELMDKLGLKAPAVAGHSFGALVGAELAAAVPSSVSKLALIDPVGLWRDDAPVRNWMLLPEAGRRQALFADPKGEGANRFFTPPEDASERVEWIAARVWAQACTGKFVWPIPDRGLRKRLHRVAAPTLLVWGSEDAIVPRSYAEDFSGAIAGARVEIVPGAGHLPHLERAAETAQAVMRFLG